MIEPKICGSQSAVRNDEDTCCVKTSVVNAIDKSCCAPRRNPGRAKLQDECCGSAAENTCGEEGAKSSCADVDDCCTDATVPKGCTQSCCMKDQSGSLVKEQDSAPKKLPSSCCDSGDSSKQACTSSSNIDKNRTRTTAGACADHLQQAFDEYSSYLEKGRCICRSVLNRLDKCCGNIETERQTLITMSGRTSSLQIEEKKCLDSCCEEEVVLVKDTKEHFPVSAKQPPAKIKEADIEATAAREHVLLGVSGMTCTGCSTKVSNVLNNIAGLSSVKVTFVTSRTEFSFDPAITNLQQVVQRIEKETGFKCSRIISDYQSLDLMIDPNLEEDAYYYLQSSVESIEKLDKGYYRVIYDPASIGSRALLSSARGLSLAPPRRDATVADGKDRRMKMAWSTGVAAVLTIPVLVLTWADTSVPHLTRSIISLVLATCVQAIAIPEFYVGALKSLIYSRVIEMDMLIVISITAAYIYSLVAFALTHAGYTLQTGELFETSSLLITLILLGRLLAAIAKVRAVSAVSLHSLQAGQTLVSGRDGVTKEIDARLLQFGDIFVVPAHSRIVTDGVIIQGQSAVDESMLTGECIPVSKGINDEVIAGTINGAGVLSVRLTRLPGKNSITDIANLVESALAAKPRVQDLADRVAGYFIPVVIVIALIVFGCWMAVAIKIRRENSGSAAGIAISYTIAVLAISCPCALGLAVPMVLVIVGGIAARSGVIIKQADAIETGHKVTDVVFDKTGTLTKGDLSVVHEQIFTNDQIPEAEIFSLTRSLTKEDKHPVSLAIAAHLSSKDFAITKLKDTQSIPGSGIQCTYKNAVLKAGNPYWLEISTHPLISSLIAQGLTLFCITRNSNLIAVFALQSTIRDEAVAVVACLQRRNMNVHIVSGDNPSAVDAIARVLSISTANIASRQTPAQKQSYVKSLMSSGKRTVLFCGDGTNDAVAIAQADVGMQIGSASDVTRGTADVVLLGGLDGVLMFLELSQRCRRRIVFNFVWAGLYNLFAILFAGGAFVKVRIQPAYAGLGEIVSVGPVILGAVGMVWGW